MTWMRCVIHVRLLMKSHSILFWTARELERDFICNFICNFTPLPFKQSWSVTWITLHLPWWHEWVMSHTCMSQVTRMNVSCHTRLESNTELLYVHTQSAADTWTTLIRHTWFICYDAMSTFIRIWLLHTSWWDCYTHSKLYVVDRTHIWLLHRSITAYVLMWVLHTFWCDCYTHSEV